MGCVIGVLEGRNSREKVEVHLIREEGSGERLDIRLFSWGEGIGWYPQKTIALDCREIDALQAMLNRAKALIHTKDRQKPSARGALVPFSLRRKEVQPFERPILKQA